MDYNKTNLEELRTMGHEQLALTEGVEAKIRAVMAARSEPSLSRARVGTPGEARQLARMIDHTQLKPDATQAQIQALCQEAREYHFAAVCVNPTHVALCHTLLDGTDVEIASVVGFPLGATLPEVKAYEAQRTIAAGATEVDMVINIGGLKDRAYERVYQDVAAVAQACQARDAILKVIIEAALLTDEEKIAACYLAQSAGADYVKTSTGFGPSGAKLKDVALMRQTVGPAMGIKAAGGIRSYQDALAMIGAGATRIGASAGVQIIQEAQAEESR
jgi:deoxyribose-phosphate aldolase